MENGFKKKDTISKGRRCRLCENIGRNEDLLPKAGNMAPMYMNVIVISVPALCKCRQLSTAESGLLRDTPATQSRQNNIVYEQTSRLLKIRFARTVRIHSHTDSLKVT